jgi:DNA-binding Lrp family transcriptional regulator
MNKDLDELDLKLVRLLQRDARQSSEKLAKALNVSPSTVRRRLRHLIGSGIVRIAGFIDPRQAGFPFVTFIGCNIAHGYLDSATQMLAKLPQVRLMGTTTGRYDTILVAAFRSAEELSGFLQAELSKVEGLKGSETLICLEMKKGNYMPI